jgi:hypothetical protein
MGAGPSSNRNDGSGDIASQDYYQLLEVEETATGMLSYLRLYLKIQWL